MQVRRGLGTSHADGKLALDLHGMLEAAGLVVLEVLHLVPHDLLPDLLVQLRK